MAVHLPLSVEAQAECRFLLLSPNNLLKPSDGAPVAVPSQDMVLGIYYLTMEKMVDYSNDEEIASKVSAKAKVYESEDELKKDLDKGKISAHEIIRYQADDRIVICEPIDVLGHYFSDVNQAILAYENGDISLHQKIRVKREVVISEDKKVSGVITTTLGRCLFNEILPQDLGFAKRETDEDYLQLEVDFHVGKKQLKKILEKVINNHGATKTAEVLDDIKAMGYKYSTRAAMTVSISDMTVPAAKKQILADAEDTVDQITKHYRRGFLTDEERYKEVIETWQDADNKITSALLGGLDKYNNIFMMADSGARGSDKQIKQLAGMRGLMADTTGKTIELPIKSNFREGLDVLEYFISAHGARKGLSDTALRTADSGYLTRRLVDVSQELIIRDVDCCAGKEIPFMEIEALMNGNEVIESLEERITGRTAAESMFDADGNMIVKANHMITPKRAAKIVATGVDKVKIRTILTCKSHNGVCAKCYGANMATGQRVQVGEAVGIIAAQSIGEPGTQLTMRTFHTGGVAGDDITQGLPRVEELFEARKPKGLAIIAEFGGKAEIKETKKKREIIVTNDETGESKTYLIPYGSRIRILDGTVLEAGDELTEGSVNPHDLLKIKGLRAVQDYMIREVQRVYRLQGVDINDKHIEVIVRQMLKKIKVDSAGDSEFLPGTTVEVLDFNEVNEELVEQGKEPAVGTQIMLGITKASLATNSFLSAASFQETTRVLTEAAINGKVDPLVGLKENVIIGKLIPAGTGMKRYSSVKLTTDDMPTMAEEARLAREAAEEAARAEAETSDAEDVAIEEIQVEETVEEVTEE
jgi:DNA-directed RNA polymerase subunit beta'